jgi:hypothetical protein
MHSVEILKFIEVNRRFGILEAVNYFFLSAFIIDCEDQIQLQVSENDVVISSSPIQVHGSHEIYGSEHGRLWVYRHHLECVLGVKHLCSAWVADRASFRYG